MYLGLRAVLLLPKLQGSVETLSCLCPLSENRIYPLNPVRYFCPSRSGWGTGGLSAAAQTESRSPPSSSSSQPSDQTQEQPRPAPRIAQPEAGGSAVTLEDSEPLFDLAVALNACGYDADLQNSSPVRLKIREEVNARLSASAAARDHREFFAAISANTRSRIPG